jgi:hypothetical protein
LAITMRLTPALAKMARGQRDHLAGADHERAALAQVRVHAPREAHVAEASETALAPICVSERTRLAAEKPPETAC